MPDSENIIITKETIKRLVKDIKEIKNNPLSSNGIFYEHSEDDMLKGQALIIGPPDTPYSYGYYLYLSLNTLKVIFQSMKPKTHQR